MEVRSSTLFEIPEEGIGHVINALEELLRKGVPKDALVGIQGRSISVTWKETR